jgi:hypothetical protein
MTKLNVLGTLLTANADDRTLTYRLLPYGEEGRTNLGRVTASKGVLTLPETPDQLLANLDHDRKRPVGRGAALDDTDDGLNATFRIAQTTAGNDLLAEAAEGLRTGASVEIEDPVIRNGQLLGGSLEWVGFVTEPAFPSARLVAADAGDLSAEQLAELSDAGVYVEPDQKTSETYAREVVIDGRTYRVVTETQRSTATTVEPAPGADSTDDPPADEDAEGDEETTDEETSEDDEEDQTVTASKAATADAALRASAANGGGRKLLANDSKPQDLFKLLAQVGKSHDQKLTAALVDITQSGAIGNTEVPQYVGELWDGKATERRIIPLFNHAPLTSYKVNGWRWLVKPAVGPYAGNKAAVPSNAVSTEPVELAAERIAGAHDIDRKYVDFGDEGFWQSYLAAMTESYAVQSDAAVMTDVLAAATAVPVGGAVAGVPAVWIKIVDGVLAVLQATNAMPNSAVLAFDLYRQFLLTPQEGGLEYLNAALGFEQGTVNQGNFAVLPHAGVAAGGALVSAREAVTVHELGTTPIRVEAQNIANGGIDVGLFGYYATNIHDEGGLALVTGTPA